jgi:hypothetical protein
MYFKCVEVIRQGQFLRYRYGYLPDGAKGHQSSCNCKIYMSEEFFPYGLALSKASPIHVSHVPYQQELLVAEGYSPLWVFAGEE